MTRCITYALLSLLLANKGLAQDSHDMTQVETAVNEYLVLSYPVSAQRHSVNITVDKFDRRLKLTKCDEALTHQILNHRERGGHVTVQTRCDGSEPWSVYVPAEVEILELVAVVTADILRGTQLGASHLEMQPRKTSLRGQGFATDTASLIGKQLKRGLRKGDRIRLSNLSHPTAIKRGDFVSVMASIGSISVVTKGTAMSAGRVGDQIRIKNNKSERIIKGRITGPGKAQVIL